MHPTSMSLCSGAWEPQLLSLCTAATEAHAPGACAPQRAKPLQQEARVPQLEKSPLLIPTREKSPHNNKDPPQLKIIIILFKKESETKVSSIRMSYHQLQGCC